MIITYEGQRYEFDFDKIGVRAAIKIEKHTGLTMSQWGRALSPEEGRDADLMAVQALGWLVLHGGRDIPVEDCDFQLGAFAEAFGRGAEEEEAARKAADEAADAAAGPTLPAAPPSGNGGGPAGVLSLPSSPGG